MVLALENWDDLYGSDMVGGHPGAVKDDPDLPALASNDLDLRDVFHFLDLIVNLSSYPSERVVIIVRTREGKGQNRDIVNGAGFDQRFTGAGWNEIEVGKHLLVEPDETLLLILPHLETDDCQ